MKYATRQALAPRTNTTGGFDSGSGNRAEREPLVIGSHWEYRDDGEPIPQKYVDEFNQIWHEYNEDNDAEQYMSDMMENAPWRMHQPIRPMYTADGELFVPDIKHRVDRGPYMRHETHSDNHPVTTERAAVPSRPQLMSRFSSYDDDTEKCTEPLTRRKEVSTTTFARYGKRFVQCLTTCRKPLVNAREKRCTKHKKTPCSACARRL
jgi:hypothetical protein